MFGINGSGYPPVNENTFCKYVLYYEINNSRVRIWDLVILIPNALFVLFLVVRFNKAQLKLRATSSPIFLTFYSLVWGNVIVSVVRCVVSMTVNAAVPLGGMVDKILWVIVRFFLLATEMSVVIFGLAFGHMDSRSSIRYVLLATSFISLAFTLAQGTLEIIQPDDMFHIDTRDYDLFGHGGMLFWFTSSLVFAVIYFIILLLPWTPLREYLALPSHMDSRSSIRYVLLATSFISLAFTLAQGTLEIIQPDDMFHIDTRDYDLFGHGGMLFWFTSSLVFAVIYFIILLLPWTPLREYLALPTKLSFYFYVLLLALLNTTQAVGAGLLVWGTMQSGLCVVDVTTWLYYSLYTPLVYHTFLSEFFSVSQPSIMFSYKAQMDEPIDDDQVSLPHQQSFSSLKTDSDYIYQQSNSVYDSTLFEAGGNTPMNPMYSMSLQSPDSIASGQSDLDPSPSLHPNMATT